MTKDPYEYDTTSCGYDIESTTYTTSGTAATTSDYGTTRWLKVTSRKSENCSTTHTIRWSEEVNNDQEKIIKKLRKKQIILDMKSMWIEKNKEYKPMIKRKPDGLKGVCFNGRGWA